LPVPCPSDKGHRRHPQERGGPDLPPADDVLSPISNEALSALEMALAGR
jgi:hypothetical protein